MFMRVLCTRPFRGQKKVTVQFKITTGFLFWKNEDLHTNQFLTEDGVTWFWWAPGEGRHGSRLRGILPDQLYTALEKHLQVHPKDKDMSHVLDGDNPTDVLDGDSPTGVEIVAAPETPLPDEPDCLTTCGTTHRGCDPQCPKRWFEEGYRQGFKEAVDRVQGVVEAISEEGP